jgi:phosphatidylglycerol---prolipoprotein diacylglyceryl transferase
LWLPDGRGESKRRYPTQLFEAAWSAIILGVRIVVVRAIRASGVVVSRLGRSVWNWPVRSRAAARGRLEHCAADTYQLAFSAVLSLVSLAAFVLKLR